MGQIFPFSDRPDVGIKVLFYPVPLNTPSIPFAHPFVLRNWDVREGLPQTPLGTDQNFKQLYFGPLPTAPPGQVCGTQDQWQNGILHDVWASGGYGTACDACQLGVYSSLCNTILPKTLRVSGDFDFFGQPFSGTATWSNATGFNVWTFPPVNFNCNGVLTPYNWNLTEDTSNPGWFINVDGFGENIGTSCSGKPITWSSVAGGIAQFCDMLLVTPNISFIADQPLT